MSTTDNPNYLDAGYNNLLQTTDKLAFTLGDNVPLYNNTQFTSSNGNVETMPVKSDGSLGDIWISTFIKSVNWQPKTVGFYIDGKTGYAEFSNVYISGNAQIGSGTIGGLTITPTSLTATSGGYTTILSSGATAFSAGPTGTPTVTITQTGHATFTDIVVTGTVNATGGYVGSTTALVYESQGINVGSTGYIRGGQTQYNTGVGFWIGHDNSGTPGYKLSIGDPSGEYLYWDGAHLTIQGTAVFVPGTHVPWSYVTNDGNAPANNATVGATWGTNLIAIPDFLGVVGPAALYVNGNYMGYWNGSAWKTYMNNTGDFYLAGTNGYLQWDHVADTLTVQGTITGASTIGGRTASTIAGAIDGTGHFIDNALNTSTASILGSFVFGVSGAIRMNTDSNNGLWISPSGIVGKHAGITTFSVDTSGNATFTGTVAASQVVAGTLTGFTLVGGSLSVGTTPNWFKVDTSGNIWSGNATLAGAETNTFAVTNAGALYAKSAIITGSTIDGTSTIGLRLASVLASAIDASGHFADSAISTATSTIITPFTFGISGALQIGSYVNGTSGDLRISPSGILARNSSGSTTFSINGTTGVATITGLVVGTNVAIGTAAATADMTTIVGGIVTTSYVNALSITAGSVRAENISAGTITGSTLQTASSGQRIVISSALNNVSFYDQYGNSAGSIYGFYIGSAPVVYVSGSFYIGGTLAVVGAGLFQGTVSSNSNNSYDLGSSSYYWRTLYTYGINLGGDYRTSWPTASMVYPAYGIARSSGSSWNSSINGYSYQFVKGDGSLDGNSYVTGTPWTGYGYYVNGYANSLTTGNINAYSSSSYNCGGASNYWYYVNTHGLTYHSMGFYDNGVTIRDNKGKLKKVSDLDAILSLRPHPTQVTEGGAPLIDKMSLPVEMYVPAKYDDGRLYDRDPETGYPVLEKQIETTDAVGGTAVRTLREIDEYADGEDIGQLLALALGAIKELNSKIDVLQQKVDKKII